MGDWRLAAEAVERDADILDRAGDGLLEYGDARDAWKALTRGYAGMYGARKHASGGQRNATQSVAR
jgi:hypothetical protein